MPSSKTYTKLPGGGAAGLQRYRLWLGPDHLLLVGNTVVGERYKRFYFADIQAFVIRKTVSWIFVGVLLVLLAGLFALGAWSVEERVVRLSLGSAAAVLGLLLGWHIFAGASCTCQIRTAVQTEKIPSLGRLRTVRKVLARLRPLIESAQAPASVS